MQHVQSRFAVGSLYEQTEGRAVPGVQLFQLGVQQRVAGVEQAQLRTVHVGRRRLASDFRADQFGAVALSLEGSGKMWFLLPDEGVTMDDLLNDEQTMEFLNSNGNWENSKHLIVNMSVPKFDVVSDLDLRDGLNALGITGVFDATVADFSPMTSKVAEIFLSKADHAARVAIDEEGVTAAAYTVMMMAGAAAPPEEEMDFVLNRPFLFAITGADGLPLFVGVVNRP